MKKKQTSNWRINLIFSGFILILIFAVIFLFRWQILEYDRYRILANQRVKDVQLSSIRGKIFAQDGSPLAYSEPTFDVFAYIPEIEDAEDRFIQTREEFILKVSSILEIEEEELKKKLNSGIMYIILKRKVTSDKKEALENILTNKNKKLVGLHFEFSEKRIYPDGTLACHILGFVGKDSLGNDVGRNGIEGYWDGDLGWKEGVLISETDSFGNEILTGDYIPVHPKEGRSIKLTVVRGLQEIVERKIKEGVEKWEAISGTVIVMDPRSGEILAMANYPVYNPNEYWKESDYNVYRNKAVSDPYEFGSVGKVFTASAAIDLKIITPNTIVIEGHEGCVNVLDDKDICTAGKKPSGPLTLTDVLTFSDNIGAFYVSEMVGAENMYKYLRKFGIGAKTYVGLAEESTSFLKSFENWNRADVATYSFGQGYSATPLQIISGLSAIPNKGKRMRPYIVSKIYEGENVIEIKPRVASEPLSKEAAMIVNDMMVNVFSRNGSKYTFKDLVNYKLAGKSGTASVLSENGLYYAENRVNVTFVGWDASDNPKFIMLMKLEEPKGAPFSVESVQPLWMETFFEIKDYVGVVPITK